MTNAYPRYPTIHGNELVFVAEDDLWKASIAGDVARRLTAGVAAVQQPRISPDGATIAYVGAEEGPLAVYTVPLAGGPSTRLTYEDKSFTQVTTWAPDGESVIYSCNGRGRCGQDLRLCEVNVRTGATRALPVGLGTALSYGDNGVVVLGREYPRDFSHWKRYRGGGAGQLWIDGTGDGQFRELVDLNGNLAAPHVIGDRVYFLSDHEGWGNVYSVNHHGADLRRHTDHDDFYARGLSGDGSRMVYHCGGALYVLDPRQDGPQLLDVDVPVTHTQRTRRFVDAAQYLDTVDVSQDGSSIAIAARGKAFSFANWEGPVTQHGELDGVRYRHVSWLPDRQRLVAVADYGGAHVALVVMRADGVQLERIIDDVDFGRATELTVSPVEARVAIVNHRNELLLWDVDNDDAPAVADSSVHGAISGAAFSPDGSWLAYAIPQSSGTDNAAEDSARSVIKLREIATRRTVVAAQRVLHDFGPAFAPDGKYLYFIGQREFNAVYDSLHFDLGFPLGSRPYAVALRADVPPPFLPQAQPLAAEVATSTEAPVTTVDVAGLTDRIVPLPVPDAKYTQVLPAVDKVLVVSQPVQGSASLYSDPATATGILDAVDVATGKVERFAEGVDGCAVTADGRSLIYVAGSHVRVVKATEKVPETVEYSRESGWIDLTRVKLSVRPESEWPQMLREAWRLVNEQFWAADLSGVDWDEVWRRYAPLVDRVSTRGELSDLIWEMHGELGTSHAYESAGDYRAGPFYWQGFLGVDAVHEEAGARLTKIYSGDVWNPDATSPLRRPGVDMAAGDIITAVNGQVVGAGVATLAQRLVNQAGQEVRLTVARGREPVRTVTVKALRDESALRYRDWVNDNRRTVHESTAGRVGYVHIPDMMGHGFAEFHRAYLNEYDRDALVIDVRFNGGGHVSQLILEKLARRRIGYNYPRWSTPDPYPRESPRGPMVALINEAAGSDGDIFSEGFRHHGLGPLIGTRTWGGVVGIFPKQKLVDNTMVTQPEVAFHFDTSKWGVENYGVAPDVEVDIAPQDYVARRDPQLRAAVEAAETELRNNPPHRPDPAKRPMMASQPLPPRPQDRFGD